MLEDTSDPQDIADVLWIRRLETFRREINQGTNYCIIQEEAKYFQEEWDY